MSCHGRTLAVAPPGVPRGSAPGYAFRHSRREFDLLPRARRVANPVARGGDRLGRGNLWRADTPCVRRVVLVPLPRARLRTAFTFRRC